MKYIKKRYALWCKLRWLKRIDREIDRYNRLKQRLTRQQYVIKQLADGYCEVYGEKLFKGGKA